MITENFQRTKLACYTAYFTMSSIFCLPPILFSSLQDLYGISYTLLGTLILINFCAQLTIDLIFTAFSRHFPIQKVVRIMPLLTTAGLLIYAMSPLLFPQHVYVGLCIGTVLFSVSAGLSEVLLSPVIAAIPSEHPQKDMSKLHSLYAFGLFTVVVVSTVFLKLFGAENWMWLTVFWALLPISASVMFSVSPIPDIQHSESSEGHKAAAKRRLGIALFAGSIFLGGSAETVMSTWISSFMENAIGVDKAVGDILGMALFAILLGITRISYAKYGKNIQKMLLTGMIGATVCYLVAGLSVHPAWTLAACILTGIFTAMLWPGTLIMMEENLPGVGVAAYALMAASGDLGAALSPQLFGAVVDFVSQSRFGSALSTALRLTTEQVGLKAGMLVTTVFPLAGIVLLAVAIRYFRKIKTA